MNAFEYKNLKRFKNEISVDFETFCQRLRIEKEQMFEVYTLDNELIFIKATDSFENILFDIKQTDQKGNVIKKGIYANSVTTRQIAERLYEGNWRFYKCN